ncbi:hypothetical protein GLOIN_2v1768396 [Rhizophagus irregularis DAOM 181602=DAOM 197198]|uniref:Uncharacterized protein n=1 Tax=Rhizophagus irregularis (strain DAOM 181602 / DAOM 197198 / MUCL 43194) TaxID=747089 RepID=A0A2P4QH35_RHIID|nr:hypothetical protein GLOIN_2v1768396 [Rhizophagus irregularis DAOM 181602=DAOM 197198]POG76930.1 hypothetical protein GLOIN_2v1768396 [Rhizophagus irregularis DAOM 181602=DAOM 197198]|eukprot:XP_025183796.1 hypothetical protein GLOIN_2v1768396 [Rhizophagus irregularis DAOM 181602=DAOM 197198]
MLEHLSIIHKKRSEETGLREISCKNLQRKTQKAVKIYKLFEKVGVDNIKYITTYSANSISELTNDKVQDIIDNFSKQNDNDNTDVEEVSIHMTEISAGGPAKILQGRIRARLPISILPDDPDDSEEKRKHIIGLVLKRFPYLSLEYSESYGDSFVFNSSIRCPICNKNHEGENIKGGWSSEQPDATRIENLTAGIAGIQFQGN